MNPMRKQGNLRGKLFVLAFCAMFLGCDDGRTFSTYADVCEVSGGTMRNNQCTCGNKDIDICEPGVVCSPENREKCAAGKIQELNLPGLACLESGKVLCADGNYQKCEGGKWSEIKTCSTQANKKAVCASNNACGECFEDEWICRQDNGKYVRQQCKKGKWATVEECGAAGCAADNTCATEQCASPAVTCQDDLSKAGVLTECKDGAKTFTKCQDGTSVADFVSYSCKTDTECGECLNDAIKCEKGNLSTCKVGKWDSSPCPDGAACKDATSCEECKTGAIKCDNGQTYKCEFGSWSLPKSCPNGASCKNDTECGECRSDTNVCTGGQIYTCINGKLDKPEPCEKNGDPVSCGQDGTACGECKDTTTKCDNGQTYKCEFGSWSVPKSCPNGASCKNDTECGDCANDTKTCTGGQIYTCINGKLDKSDSCEKNGVPVSCGQDGTSCGECKDTTTKCEGNQLSTCASGTWGAPTPCPGGSSCATASMCGACENSKKSCQKGKQYKCENGKWDWDNFDVCEFAGAAVSCKSVEECGECQDTTTKCEGNQLSTCASGTWGAPTPCPGGASCATDSMCGVCENGKKSCQNGKQYECENGKWDEPMACPNNFSCKSAEECGECIDEQVKCENDANTHVGIVKKCSKGTWIPTTCDPKASCTTAGKCGDCVDGATKCDSIDGRGHVSTCKDGVWEKNKESCGALSCNADNTNCGECLNDSVSNCQNQGGNQIGEEKKCEKGKWIPKQCDINTSIGLGNSCSTASKRCGDCNITKTPYCNKDGNSSNCVDGVEKPLAMCDKMKGCNKETGRCN